MTVYVNTGFNRVWGREGEKQNCSCSLCGDISWPQWTTVHFSSRACVYYSLPGMEQKQVSALTSLCSWPEGIYMLLKHNEMLKFYFCVW